MLVKTGTWSYEYIMKEWGNIKKTREGFPEEQMIELRGDRDLSGKET